jgi:hypothetical protein
MKSSGPLAESTGIDLASVEARRRLARDGYLFLRGLLPPEDVAAVEAAILEAVAGAGGWLAEGTDPDEWIAGPSVAAEGYDDPDFWAMYRRVQSSQSFHEFAHHPLIFSTVEGLLEDKAFVHSNHVARVVGPSERIEPTQIHQDWRPIQGAADTLTVWIPLADIPSELGGLRILEGSQHGGVVPYDPVTESILVDDEDPRWRSASYRRGDVLIFHSLTVHAGTPNTTDRLRRSCEFRYQRISDPAVASTVTLPHWHPSIDWPELTEGWTSLASIEVPDFVEFEQLDDTAPHLPTPPSRLLGTS